MGCLIKLIVLPLWWTLRLIIFGLRLALQRTTPLRLVGYLFALFVALSSPAALVAAALCRLGRAWYRAQHPGGRRVPVLLAFDAAAAVLAAVAVLLWHLAQKPPYWIVSAWGGQFVLALFGGLVLHLAGDHSAWDQLGFLVDPRRFAATWATGILLGPAAYLLFTVFFRLPALERRLREQDQLEARWRQAVQPSLQTRRMRRALKRSRRHPFGYVRWGWDQVNDRPYDVEPTSLSRHLSLLGVTGSGKTTAIARLAEGLLEQGWAVIFLDCKGGGLRLTAKRLADASAVPYRLVDPASPEATLRYNPCTGSPADISNKLIGAFSFGTDGEVYKQVSQLALGMVSAALQELDRPVTLNTLQAGLTPEAIRGTIGALAKAGKTQLSQLMKDALDTGRLQSEALATLRARLTNFQRSHFAPILLDPTKQTAFDLDQALDAGVTYLSLPSTAASEDVPLMGRILLQDLKQAVARREQRIGGFARHLPTAMSMAVSGVRAGNALLVIDEFAALQDPTQLQDLLLQARSAGVTLALSSQLMPQDGGLAAAVKGVGMFASMRVSDVDAEQVSNLFGTYQALEVTQQTGQVGVHPILTGTGSVRTVMRFVAHPNDIKALPDASAVVKLDRPAGQGRTISVVRFWPAASDWPIVPAVPPPRRLATGSMVAEAEENLPWLPEPPSAVPG